MRVAATTLLTLLTLVAVVPAREPTKQELLLAVEKQLKTTSDTAGPAGPVQVGSVATMSTVPSS